MIIRGAVEAHHSCARIIHRPSDAIALLVGIEGVSLSAQYRHRVSHTPRLIKQDFIFFYNSLLYFGIAEAMAQMGSATPKCFSDQEGAHRAPPPSRFVR